jgi:uncharacterized protein (TIGR02596 family)
MHIESIFLRPPAERPSSLPERPRTSAGNQGFTLVELLVVVGIIVLLAGFLAPAASSLLRGNQMAQAGQMLTDQMTFARQTALSTNRPVEVRFYRYGDPQTPGEAAASPGEGKYRGFQLFELQPDGTTKALGKLQRLPTSTIIDSSVELSSILNQSERPEVTPTGNESIPGVGTAYRYSFFRFQTDGSTDLLEPASPGTPWFLTVHELGKGDGLSAPPANFYTVQINAHNGTIRTFRP